MDLGPGFGEPKLPLREVACQELNGIDCEDTNRILVVRMKVRPMMRCGRLREHTDDDAEESGELWHSTWPLVDSTSELASFYAVRRLAPAAQLTLPFTGRGERLRASGPVER